MQGDVDRPREAEGASDEEDWRRSAHVERLRRGEEWEQDQKTLSK